MRDVIFVGHAADRTGAPMSLLHLLRWLRSNTDLDFELLLRTGGEMLEAFREVARVEVMQPDRAGGPSLLRHARGRHTWRRGMRRVRARPPRLLFWNSLASGSLVEALLPLPCPVLGRIPECRHVMETHGVAALQALCDRAAELVAVSDAVARDLDRLAPEASKKVRMLPEFVPLSDGERRSSWAWRAGLGIPESAVVAGGVGTLGWRKGTDLFVQLARTALARPGADLHFVWIGDDPGGLRRELEHDTRLIGIADRVHWLPASDEVSWFYDEIDVFALTSREDPLALVALEAAERGVPILCFRDAGGVAGFVGEDAGVSVPYLDVTAMSAALRELAGDADRRLAQGAAGRERVRREHAVEVVAPRILERIRVHLEHSGGGAEQESHEASE